LTSYRTLGRFPTQSNQQRPILESAKAAILSLRERNDER
jgi:hypothetical protein